MYAACCYDTLQEVFRETELYAIIATRRSVYFMNSDEAEEVAFEGGELSNDSYVDVLDGIVSYKNGENVIWKYK